MKRTTTLLLAVTLLLSGLTGLVAPTLAQTSSPTDQAPAVSPDGIVAVIHPQNVVAQGDAVVMHPVNGRYLFEVSIYNGTGGPLAPQSFSYGLYAPDAGARDPSTFSPTSSYWTPFTLVKRAGTSSTGSNMVTVSLSAADIGFGSTLPLNGVAFFFTLRATNVTAYPADGEPTSHYNIAANHAAEAGQWQDADTLGQSSFTTVVFVTTDGTGLAEADQPVLNPDFALGLPANVGFGSFAALDPQQSPAPVTAPPWDLELGGAAQNTVAQSTTEHTLAGDGSALTIHVDPADISSGSDLQLTQNIGEFQGMASQYAGQHLPLNWTNPQSMTARVRVVGATSADLALVLTYTPRSGTYSDHVTAYDTFHVNAADGWVNLSMPLAGHCDYNGAAVNCPPHQAIDQVVLEVTHATTSPADQAFDLQVDSVRVHGATAQPVTTSNDLTDGYATYIHPLGLVNDAPGTSAVADSPLTTLSGSQYLFEVQVWNTITNAPVPASKIASVATDFQLGHNSPGGLIAQALGPNTFQLADGSGVLVAVPASQVPAGTLTDGWFWANLGPAYTDTFGTTSSATSGYYSILKNSLQGFQAADAADYAVTGLALTGQTVGTFEFHAGLRDLQTNPAGAGSTTVTVVSDSPALEPLTVSYKDQGASAFTTVPTAPVGQGVSDIVTLPYLHAGATLMVNDGQFTKGLTVHVGVPSVAISTLGLTGVTDAAPAQLGASTWIDPCMTSANWTIKFAGSTGGVVLPITASGQSGCISMNDAITSYQFPAMGNYQVILSATDSAGKSASDVADVSVANAPPVFVNNASRLMLEGCPGTPGASSVVVACNATDWRVDAGQQLTFQSLAHDQSVNGHLSGVLTVTNATLGGVGVPDAQNDGGYVTGTYVESMPFNGNAAGISLPSPGAYTVRVTWTDNDGASITSVGTVTAVAPQVTLRALRATPTSGGRVAGQMPALQGEDVTVQASLLLRGDGLASGASLVVTNATGVTVDVQPNATARVIVPGASIVTFRATVPGSSLPMGTYNVNLQGTTFEGTDLSTLTAPTMFTVVADHAPHANLTSSVVPAADGKVYVQPNQPITLAIQSQDPDCSGSGPRCTATVTWDLGDGSSATGPSVTISQPHHTTQQGLTVVATVTDDAGKSVNETFTYVVNDQLTLANLDVPGTPTSDGDGGQMYAISSEAVRFKGLYITGNVQDLNGTARASTLAYSVSWSPLPAAAHQGATVPTPTASPISGSQNTGRAGSFGLNLDTRTGGLATKPGLYTVDITVVPTGVDPVVTPDEQAHPATADVLHTTIEVWVGPWAQNVLGAQ